MTLRFNKNIFVSVLALFVLNALMSMTNWWPTPFVELDKRIAPEFVLLWVIVLALVLWRGGLSKRLTTGLTLAYLVLVVGRYFDTTAPALFGRNINLYWDGLQIPRVVWVSLKSYPFWVSVVVVAAVLMLFWLLYKTVRWAISTTAREVAPYALNSVWALVVTALASILVIANVRGARETWPYVSKPALPTYIHQAKLLMTVWDERQLQKTLPASPTFDSDLGALQGIDVNIFFLESYGQVAYTVPAISEALDKSREKLADQIASSGMQVVSAYVGSTTYGGASELAHVAFLTGIDTGNPTVHDLLITTERPTLTGLFRQRGYEIHALYSALTWDWPEKKFYGFDKFTDARGLAYPGPKLGFWSVPDQYAIARYEQLNPITPTSPKRLMFFPSITSHMPFHPVPPYQADWRKLLSDTPFDAQQLQLVGEQRQDWFNMRPGYIGMIDYNYRWLGGLLEQPRAREAIYIVLGDHQPAANVTGEGATWDVPVHIISKRADLLQRFTEHGFVLGLTPQQPQIGKIFDFTRFVLKAFNDAPQPQAAQTSSPSAQVPPAQTSPTLFKP
jgi:hypothetical protein